MRNKYRLYIDRIHSNVLWDYILVYLLLLLSAGFFFRHQYNRYTSPIYILLLLLTIVARSKKLKRDTLIPTLSMIALMLFTAIITGLSYFENYLYSIISLVTAYLITQLFSYKKICSIFSNLLYCICIASIIGWFLVQFIPSIVLLFPRLVNNVGFDAHYLGLVMLGVPNYVGFVNRAQGIFWEPGAFQTMIVIAGIADLFVNNNFSRKRFFVYFLTLILTLSTTGYICLLMMIAILIVKDKKKIPTVGIGLFVITIIALIILFRYRDRLPSFLYYTLFTKMQVLLSYKPGVTISNVPAEKTVYVRMNAIYYPFIEFLKSPIWGIGFAGYDQLSKRLGYNMFTFTPINYFAYYGLLYAGIVINGFFKIVKRFKASKLCKLLIIFLILITISSENYCGNVACITIFILYGYGENENCIDNVEGVM